MSDNYYATKTEVIVENLDEDGLSVTVSKTTRIHIGKSSPDGWAFQLHIYPNIGITGETSMLDLLSDDGWTIDSDLYGSIDVATFQRHMQVSVRHQPVRHRGHCAGSSNNCDYFTNSFS